MGSVVLLAATVISKIAGLLFKIPLTNMLGGVGMGYYSSAYTVFTPVFAICAGSISPAITQYISKKSATVSKDKLISIRNSSLLVFGGLGFTVSGVMMLLSDFIAGRIIGNSDAKYAIMAISPCVFIEAVTAVYRGYYEGERNMTPTAVSQVTEAITRVIFGLGFAYLARDYSLPIIAGMAVWGVTLSNVAGLIYLIIKTGKTSVKGAVIESKSAIKSIVSLMVPIALASLASGIMTAADLSCIILGIKSSLEKAPELYTQKYADAINYGIELEKLPNFLYGSFTGLSMTVFALVPSLCGVLGRSALPNITHETACGNAEAVRREIKRTILITIYIALPASLGISVMAEQILTILFGSKPIEVAVATEPLAILGLGGVFLCLSGVVFSMLQAIGRQDLPVKITVAGAVIKLIGNTILIPLPCLELSGAAIASTVSYAVMAISGIIQLYRLSRVKATLIHSAFIPAFASLASVFVAKYVYILTIEHLSNLVSTGISVTFAVITYILTLLALDKTTKNTLSRNLLAK